MLLLGLLTTCLAVEANQGPGYGTGNGPIVGSRGRSQAIPSWDLISTAKAQSDVASLSRPGADTSSWYKINARSTVMHGLMDAGVYQASKLFFSDDLESQIDYSQYRVPWLYSNQFGLNPHNGDHFFLKTSGITSKADIYLNGKQIAGKSLQSGAYGGHVYDITSYAQAQNNLLIKAYPTDYDYDFALGFVDWNPYPPDNGTGVWRDVEIKQTGPVLMGPLRIVTDWTPGSTTAKVMLKADVTNLESHSIKGNAAGMVIGPDGHSKLKSVSQSFSLGPHEVRTLELSSTISDAQIWWPKQWGEQPLYTAQLAVTTDNSLSDQSAKTNFGIRHVTSEVNQHNDTIFTVNGHPFQVLGSGYAPDMFLRWDSSRFETQAKYVLDMGMNTIRLEGKMEQPELYDITDRLGLMVMPGWECCDKWEAWSYNDELAVNAGWNNNDYATANASMRHEASALQTHPSILAYLVGSDFWPDDRAAAIYVDALHDADWQVPIICSAAKRGYPEILGPSGMKMDGPYDWVPPNYWYGDQLGAAFGFGSELGAGVGTPELESLKKFLSDDDLADLWQKPNKGLYHMSTNVSSFHTRKIYNKALWNRYGAPTSLDDYLLKAQMMDYEATRAEYEAYSAKWNAERPATGLVYWMLNNAWPSLHWNQFDYYLHPAGSYFGTKVGARLEHVAYDYAGNVWLINHSLARRGARQIKIEVVALDGTTISSKSVNVQTEPNTSKQATQVPGLAKLKDVAILRLLLLDQNGNALSRNVYWITNTVDKLRWAKSTWYYTPVSEFVDYTSLNHMRSANVAVTTRDAGSYGGSGNTLTLENKSKVPAVFIRLNLVDAGGEDVTPVYWMDNYVTLLPGEKLEVGVSWDGGVKGAKVVMDGKNVAVQTINLE